MENLIPTDFIQTLGGLIGLLAVVAGIVSLVPSLRAHSLKLMALFFVASLALFSAHWSTYFASLFIIATAVTELEFLQNLAAIIRGNKEYFDYKKEALTTEQMKEKIEDEQKELEQAVDTKPTRVDTKQPQRNDIRRIMDVESKALDHMEEYYNAKIERGVRISSGNVRIELDGLIPSIVDDMMPEKILEVKYIRNKDVFSRRVRDVLHQMESLSQRYRTITNKIAKLHVVLVIEGSESLNNQQLESLKKMIDSSSIAMGYSVFTTVDLGIE